MSERGCLVMGILTGPAGVEAVLAGRQEIWETMEYADYGLP